MEVTRGMIESQARTYLDVRWRHQGRTRENGIDCVGLPACVGQDFGLWEILPAAYSRRPDHTFVPHFREHLVPRKPREADVGDVLLFAPDDQRHICHCGIRTNFNGQPGLIHAWMTARKVIEEPLDIAEQLLGRPRFVFSFPGVA